MRWPWQQDESTPASEHAEQQDARVEEAQAIIEDTRDHSDRELKRVQGILDDVRRSERALAELYKDAERRRSDA